MLNKEIYKKIEYYLYNYNDIDKKIVEIEEEIINNIHYTTDKWLSSKNQFTSTIENQAIKLASNKELQRLRKWKKIIYNVLEHYKQADLEKYNYIVLRYIKKENYKQIECKMYIDSSVQARVKKEIIYYIAIFAYKGGLIGKI